MSSRADQRVLTIDIAKGLGILLVVLGHNGAFRESAYPLYVAVYLFHMPLFFFLSGTTFRLTSVNDALNKRARALLVPYFAMGGVALVAGMASGALPERAELLGILYATGHTIRFVPLWFLPCLFLVSICATIALSGARAAFTVDRFEKARPFVLAGLAVVGLVGGALILSAGVFAREPYVDESGRPLGLPWSLDLVPFALGVFLSGTILAGTRVVRSCPVPLLVILAGAGVLAWLVAEGVSLDMNYRRMTDGFAVVLAMAAGTAMVLALSSLLARVGWAARLFSYLGSASLVILMLHSPVQRRVLEPLIERDVNAGVAVVLSVSITVGLICAIDHWILRRVRAIGWVVYPRRPAAGVA